MTRGDGPTPRVLEVDATRLPRWVDGFAERHGEPSWAVTAEGDLRLEAADSSTAELHTWASDRPPPRDRDGIRAWAEPPRRLGLLLVRRGGYAVGLAEGDRLARHHCGTRYVQSRTAAGGWSQQRFARRRGNQADSLVAAVASRAAQIVVPGHPVALVVGGDRALVHQLLQQETLRGLVDLPRRELYDIPDPRFTVLEKALRRARAVRVRLTEPPEPAGPEG